MKNRPFSGMIINCEAAAGDSKRWAKVLSCLKNKTLDFLMLTTSDSMDCFERLSRFCESQSTDKFLVIPAVVSAITRTRYLPKGTELIASSVLDLKGSLAYPDKEDDSYGYDKIRELRGKGGFCYVYSPRYDWKSWYVPYIGFNGFVWDGKNKKRFESVVDYYLSQRLRVKIIGVTDPDSTLTEKEMIFTCVNSNGFTKGAIIRALSEGKCFVSNSTDLSCTFNIGKEEYGGTFHTKSFSKANLEIGYFSASSSVNIKVVKNSHVLKEKTFKKKNHKLTIEDKIFGDTYYRVMINDSPGHICLSNPIFVKTDDWQWGDHHFHIGIERTSFLAKEIGLDYIQLSEHINPGEEKGLSNKVLKRYCSDRFKVFPGVEFHRSSKEEDKYGSHILAFPVTKSYRSGIGVKKTLDQLAKDGLLTFIAHPFMDTRLEFAGFPSFEEKDEFYPMFDGIEIVHGHTYHFTASPHKTPDFVTHGEPVTYARTERLWDDCLTNGMRCTGIGNSDSLIGEIFAATYTINWGIGLTPTIVHAKKPETKEIYKSLKQGYCWFTNGTFRYLDVRLDDRHMGEMIPGEERPRSAILKVSAESITPVQKIIIIGNGKIIKEITSLKNYTINIQTKLRLTDELRYIRVKVMDKNGSIAFSNPIYIQRPLSKRQIVKSLGRKGYSQCNEK